jgi:hypothetical protein
MTEISINKVSFSAEALKGTTLKEAWAANSHIDRRIVTQAWEKANPKKVKKQ